MAPELAPPPESVSLAGLAGQPARPGGSATSDAAIFTGGTYVAQAMLSVAGLIQKGHAYGEVDQSIVMDRFRLVVRRSP